MNVFFALFSVYRVNSFLLNNAFGDANMSVQDNGNIEDLVRDISDDISLGYEYFHS